MQKWESEMDRDIGKPRDGSLFQNWVKRQVCSLDYVTDWYEPMMSRMYEYGFVKSNIHPLHLCTKY